MTQLSDVDGCRRVLRITSRHRIARASEHYIWTSQALRNHPIIELRGLTSEETCEAIKVIHWDTCDWDRGMPTSASLTPTGNSICVFSIMD
jgi:hypothetical protein